MANVLDALKNMFIKLGGDKTKLNNNHDISDYINDIADVLKDDIEIASELPIVSTDDNGKVLGVVEGNWSKTDVPSEVPAASAADIGKVLGIVSDGASGAEYGAIAASSNVVIIEFPDEFPEEIQSLPTGITGEYIYNLIHSGKIVFFKAGLDSGEGTFFIPVVNAIYGGGVYTIRACLMYPILTQGNINSVNCYEIVINDNTVHADYAYFNPS